MVTRMGTEQVRKGTFGGYFRDPVRHESGRRRTMWVHEEMHWDVRYGTEGKHPRRIFEEGSTVIKGTDGQSGTN